MQFVVIDMVCIESDGSGGGVRCFVYVCKICILRKYKEAFIEQISYGCETDRIVPCPCQCHDVYENI